MRCAFASAVFCAALLPLTAPAVTAQEGGERPKVIVLGFDGVDHALASRFMSEGHLPNLSALAKDGTFSRLETTNPAESAVSWSTFGRGLNPGKTNMFGFVCRGHGSYFPEVRFMKVGDRPYSDFYEAPSSIPWTVAMYGALGGFLVGLLLALVRGAGGTSGVVLGLVSGGAAGVLAVFVVGGGDAPPERVPTLERVIEGEALWDRLDDNGVRVKGFLVPMAAPFDEFESGGQMTGGLGVPDVAGRSTGSYSIFSTSRQDVPVGTERGTSSGGEVVLLKEKDGVFHAELAGPSDKQRRTEVEDRLKHITRTLRRNKGDAAALKEEQSRLKEEKAAGFDSKLDVRVRRVDGDQRVEVTVGDQTVTVDDGAWSGWIPLRFDLRFPLGATGLLRFRVLSIKDDIRLFFSPIGYDPRHVPQHMCMESPHGFGKQLAEQSGGLFDTTGWACITNPLKDMELGEQPFLEQMEQLTKDRSAILYHALGQDDYDFYFSMFGETDRVQHLMFRLFDEKNPMYDAELAEQYGSAIVDCYKRMDDVIGEVMAKHVDDNTTLLIVSDHGFTSFHRQMAINSWLIEEGYLVPKRGGRDPKAVMQKIPAGQQQDYLLYMDQTKSRAFALGLGKIYINKEGREANGIVGDDEYEALCAEITEKLLALRDPKNGKQVVRRVWRHHELYTGEYAETDADLYLGFAENYRVSWSTTTGGFSAEVIEDNDSKWSGDHASNDPEVVPGVLFSNRKIADGQRPSIIDMAPTILALYGAPTEGLDGKIVTFQ